MKNDELAARLRKLRELKGFSQEAVAFDLGISARAYSKLERGESKITIERFFAVCLSLKVEPKDILLGNNLTPFVNGLGGGYGKSNTPNISPAYSSL